MCLGLLSCCCMNHSPQRCKNAGSMSLKNGVLLLRQGAFILVVLSNCVWYTVSVSNSVSGMKHVLKCWYCGQFGLHALYTSGATSTVFLSLLLPRNMTVTVRKSLGIRKAQHEFELLCLDVLLWCNIQLLSKQCSDGTVRQSNSYKRCTMASDWLE